MTTAAGVYVLFLGVFFTLPCESAAQQAEAGPADSVDLLVLRHMEEHQIPGASLVVMRDGEVVKQAAYGRASLELDVEATPATVFPYASIAKIFAGTAILRLVQDGRLSLDDRATDVLPDLPGSWASATVRHLLSHTSGLPELNSSRDPVFRNPFLAPLESRDEILSRVKDEPLQFAPGEGFAYNQTNYLLLAMILETRDGRTIDEYVREEFADPLGLTSLTYGDSRLSLAGRATWYSAMDLSTGTPRPTPPRPLWVEYPTWLHTAAGLNGTAMDLARFVAAISAGRLLGPELRREMWSPVKLAEGSEFQFTEGGGPRPGLGWWVEIDADPTWVEMGGAASSVVRHYVEAGLTITVLTNLQGARPEALVEKLAGFYLRTDPDGDPSAPAAAREVPAPVRGALVPSNGAGQGIRPERSR